MPHRMDRVSFLAWACTEVSLGEELGPTASAFADEVADYDPVAGDLLRRENQARRELHRYLTGLLGPELDAVHAEMNHLAAEDAAAPEEEPIQDMIKRTIREGGKNTLAQDKQPDTSRETPASRAGKPRTPRRDMN